ncbi:MAG: acetyl-CoA carboxylase carboxyltransferase subunit alpha [Gemmataceae bacterium]
MTAKIKNNNPKPTGPAMIPAPLPFEQDIFDLEELLAKMEASTPTGASSTEEIRRIRREIASLKKQRYSNLSPWDTVLVARHPNRPQTVDYLDLICDEFVELHGDRAVGDDRAIRAGFAKLDGRKVVIIGHQKGKSLAERQQCFYGCAHPEGYRKAMRVMSLAEKFRLPVVCLIDTPGAYPGIGAEERGQSQLIADSLTFMAGLKTIIVCVVIGEGGSGGALGIGIGDRVSMLEHAYYSVISPEGCAGILWKVATDETKPRAAEALRFISKDLKTFGVIDDVIPEPLGGAHRSPREMGNTLKSTLTGYLDTLGSKDLTQLLNERYAKFRKLGPFLEAQSTAGTAESANESKAAATA